MRGKPGRLRRRPDEAYAERGLDSEANRKAMRRRGIVPRIARRGEPHGSGLGKAHWVAERLLPWLHHFGRLRVRKDWSAEIHQGLLDLAASILCFRRLTERQLC